jgi:transitional endoplasmic reticulum ATPase
VEPPSGVLLAGPPGTGKTTVAKVLAAQARCSFYPVSAADITSKWLGESEKNVQDLFQRARENRPSVIFIDEIDGIAGTRGGWDTYDRQLTELLQQMDGIAGQAGVLVVAATNRPDELDPALLRGGRLSRTITLPLPDGTGRAALLRLFTKDMPMVSVDLDAVAARTDGWSGADLHALVQQAGLHALMTARRKGVPASAVRGTDFDRAIDDRAGTAPAPASDPTEA